MMKKKKAPLILTFIFTALSGLSFGLSLSANVMLALRHYDSIYAIAAFGGLLGGLFFGIAAIACLLRYKSQLDRYNAIHFNFLTSHPRILFKDAFLARVNKENLGIAVFDYTILSNISPEEKSKIAPRLNEIPAQRIEGSFKDGEAYLGYLPPSTILFAVKKGDLRANAEDIAKQSLATFGLDPTLPTLKFLVGIEDDKSIDAKTRLEHAIIAASYDSLSRLSGEALVYDKAMEVSAIGEGYDIESAIKEDRLELSYVQLLNKRNKTAALFVEVKLFDASRGLILRRDLFREADNLGFATRMDSHIVAQAIKTLVEWDAELRHKPAMLILPCTRSSLYEAAFLFNVKKFALDNGIALSRLCLGIPGSLLADDESYTATLSKKAHALGLKVAILDFASKCPLHRIKEIVPDIVSFDDDFATLDPRLKSAEVAILGESASLFEKRNLKGVYTPDLYPQKEATPDITLENLRLEEEFRL